MADLIPVTAARDLLGAPMLQYRWELVIPDPPAVVLPFVLDFSLRARSTVIPGVEIESVKSKWGPFEFNIPIAKKYSQSFPVKFEEGYKFPVLPAIWAWSEAVFSETSGYGLRTDELLANIWLRLLGPGGRSLSTVESYHLYNAFPLQHSDSPVAYESAGQVMLDVVFAYDYWRFEPWPF